MSTMHAEPANNNNCATEFLLQAFADAVEVRAGTGASFAEREEAGLAIANEICRRDQERDLTRRASRWTAAEIQIDGAVHRRHSQGTGVYHGLCGTLQVPRWLYRRVGMHNGPTTVPLELDAGLMERATPSLAFAVAQGYAQAPSRQVHATMQAHYRLPPSRSTTERIAKGIGDRIVEALPRIEPIVRAREQLPEGTPGIVVGLDRTSAPMEEPAEPPKESKPRKKPYQRKKPDPIDVNYRMAYVGTVSFIDKEGHALVTRRYGATADDGPSVIVSRMMADVRHARDLNKRLRIGVIQDGAPEMWNLLRSGLRKDVGVRRWHEALDRHHLLERLADVLVLCKYTQPWRKDKLREWNDRLDRDDDAIDDIRRFVTHLRDTHRGDTRVKLDKHLTFLENNHDRMRYATLRAAGFPVGSGTTEGACKSLVMTRAKRCGQRWHVPGLRSVLTLRALDMSHRLRTTFDLLAHEYTASLKVAA